MQRPALERRLEGVHDVQRVGEAELQQVAIPGAEGVAQHAPAPRRVAEDKRVAEVVPGDLLGGRRAFS